MIDVTLSLVYFVCATVFFFESVDSSGVIQGSAVATTGLLAGLLIRLPRKVAWLMAGAVVVALLLFALVKPIPYELIPRGMLAIGGVWLGGAVREIWENRASVESGPPSRSRG